MAASVMLSSVTLKPAGFTVEKMSARGLPSLTRASPSSFRIVASGVKKIKTDKPFGVNGSMDLRDGVDASGRKGKGYGVYKFVDKYGANVDGYSPIYNEEEWAPGGDTYKGGVTGLVFWAATLAGLLGGGPLVVYNTGALAQNILCC
uniref:Photosystem II 10 kDa polypeptide, chloroplastic n=1 Tax=Eutrema halophilum TaxID=98038 RepID=B4YYB9_EUTHA|nr:ST244 [Eutrema halophilum]